MSDPIVVTTHGQVRGTTLEGTHSFRGIPFAAPPVGSLRSRPPVPAEPWSDVRDATKAGPVAPQPESPLEKLLGAPAPHWDEASCLTLNVWTPGLGDKKRPVMVWIHGGAFVNGSGSSPIYDGTRFSEHGDVVVVTINYRLGVFGFLHLEDIFGDEYAGSGLAGILDQVAALEWVRDNIAAFGGDPDCVTIFGESAGAMSIGTLLGLPSAEGLYHRAILQSGAAAFAHSRDAATTVARKVLAEAGITTMEEFDAVPAEALLDAQIAVVAQGDRTELPFMPVVDGQYLPNMPQQSIAAGVTGDVTTLIGTTHDEMTLFLLMDLGAADPDGEAVAMQMENVFGEGSEEALKRYQKNRPDASYKDVLVAVSTDRVFRIPAIRLAEEQIGAGRDSFMYLFTWASPVFDGLLKSCHALELPFMWDALDQPGLSMLTGDGEERQAIADDMHAAWIAFARTGNPGWDAYDLDRRATRRFDVEPGIMEDPMGDERELWKTIA